MSDSDEKKDLTAIENLSDFFHEDDPEIDSLFKEINDVGPETPEDPESFPPEFNIHEELESEDADDNEEESLPEFHTSEAVIEEDNYDDELDSSFEELNSEQDLDDIATPEAFENLDAPESFESIEALDEPNTSSATEDFEDFSEDSSFNDEQNDEQNSEQHDHLVAEDPNELFDSFENEADTSDESSSEIDIQKQPTEALIQQEKIIKNDIAPLPIKNQNIATQDKEEFIQDMKSFNENFSIGSIAFGGNPPFAIILRNIKFKEDGKEILDILKETKLINEKNQKDYEYGIEQGALLISQISEFSAIYLAHKFRRFDLDISVGLADELHISENYTGNPKGLISKESLNRVTSEYVDLKRYSNLKSEDIITSTTESIDAHHVAQYLGVITSSEIVSESLVVDDTDVLQVKYKELTHLLRDQAVKMKANGVLNISFNLSKLPEKNQYHIICTGNAVRLKRKI